LTGALAGTADMVAAVFRASPVKMLASAVLTALGGAAWPLLAVALKLAVTAMQRGDMSRAGGIAAFAAADLLGALILQHFAYTFGHAEAAEMATVRLQSELITLAGQAGIAQHEDPAYADRAELLKKGTNEFHDGILGLMSLVSLVSAVSVTALLLAFLDPWLLLLPLAALPPVLASHRAQAMVNAAREASAADTRQADHLFELATSARPAKEVRLFRLQPTLRRQHAAVWEAAGTALWRAERRAAAAVAAGQLVFGAAYMGAVLLVLRQAVAGHAGVGDVVLVIVLSVQVNQQVTAALELFRKLQRMAQGMERMRWLRAAASPGPAPGVELLPPGRLRRGIELRHVAFAYPGGGEVLRDVSVFLPAGSTVAVVGDNGAGKTTLVNLLCGFYQPAAGRITVDGTDIAAFPAGAWRSRLAAAFQDFVRFELPARDTVGVGDLPRAGDDDAVRAALGRASAEDVVDRLPGGLSAHLGKTWAAGAELSGGQWQKLAVARAMMRDDPLLVVLDEPAAALDAQAEHVLFEQYAQHARRAGRESGAVTVFVSHRFSTVQVADLIVVLSGGRVAEAGTHAELLARGGPYADLYRLQAMAYAEEEVAG
jgi:ATP-binding cassette, subfamily B, bacterial